MFADEEMAMRLLLTTIGVTCLLAAGAEAAPGLEGTWLRGDGNARVRIAPCGEQICATNVWVGDNSRNEAVGDRLVMTLSRQPDRSFSGTAYDPKRDWSYALTIETRPGALSTRGCILGRLLCREVNWTAAR
jgi:uncharacterized protein (DUF2147 family)